MQHFSLERKNATSLGSGCDSVERAVATDTRGLQIESSHQQKSLLNIYKEKEAGNGLLKTQLLGPETFDKTQLKSLCKDVS